MKSYYTYLAGRMLLFSHTEQLISEDADNRWIGCFRYIKPGEVTHILWSAKSINGPLNVRLIWMILLFLPFVLSGQDESGTSRVMFYNVENFFDPFDDPCINDEEFTPDGARSWTYGNFMEKAVRIARVVLAAGNPDPPVIVGLAEVENRFVLEKLIYETPLSALNYRIIHSDSPDSRGIDVALLYRRDHFNVDTFYYAPVVLPDTASRTRDILVVTGILEGEDSLALVVNHWPSRYGGAAGSEPRRMAAAGKLSEVLDGILTGNPCSNIVVMGDFNDSPDDPSMQLITGYGGPDSYECIPHMINLMPVEKTFPAEGTIKHEGHWYFFDQIIVSGNLLQGTNGLAVKEKKAAVLSAAFLLETDDSHLGMKPYRSFLGPAYHHGFSDHLPVMLDIIID